MTDHRSRIVKRVVHSLEETRDPEDLVRAYFDAETDVVIEATRETLEATREDTSDEKIADAVERELVEALRFPPALRTGGLPWAYVYRGRLAGGLALAAAIVSALLLLL